MVRDLLRERTALGPVMLLAGATMAIAGCCQPRPAHDWLDVGQTALTSGNEIDFGIDRDTTRSDIAATQVPDLARHVLSQSSMRFVYIAYDFPEGWGATPAYPPKQIRALCCGLVGERLKVVTNIRAPERGATGRAAPLEPCVDGVICLDADLAGDPEAKAEAVRLLKIVCGPPVGFRRWESDSYDVDFVHVIQSDSKGSLAGMTAISPRYVTSTRPAKDPYQAKLQAVRALYKLALERDQLR